MKLPFAKSIKPDLTKEITDKFMGFSRIMHDKNIPVLTLSVYESEPQEFKGGWQNIDANKYYPFEILDNDEQDLIRNNKHYTRINMVQGELPGIRKYHVPSVEYIFRRRVHPLLPKLVAESELNYQTDITSASYERAAKDLAKTGTKLEDLQESFDEGMKNYRAVTESLYKNAGVYNSLLRLEEYVSPIDELKRLVR